MASEGFKRGDVVWLARSGELHEVEYRGRSGARARVTMPNGSPESVPLADLYAEPIDAAMWAIGGV